MKISEYVELVNNIPVDQKAPANSQIKRFLLEKVRLIFANKNVIEKAKIQKKKDDVLDAYKKSVGFDKTLSALKKAKDQLKKVERQMMEIGLNDHGELLGVNDRSYYGMELKHMVLWSGNWEPVSKETADKINRVHKLLKAVEGEVEPFTTFDQLETRMMMASTVGEAMAIINAIAGEEVFRVKRELLALPEK